MADEIEYLRAQVIGIHQAQRIGRTPAAAGSTSGQEWDFMPPARENPHYTTEEQEEIQALRDGGHIDEVEYRNAMKALGINVTGVEITEDAGGIQDDPLGFFADDE